ncbi:hypothetical protein AMTRI_Chr07g78460 [Amborella trichopoda]|uniref:Uncharacterized protein n=1 Tax=Amborella trichopoda TaxID=13333 RepID=W1PSC5_AMBTC|nr:hypothetical protein AMTR_s00050p00213890 [Amborella trichopoda]
MVAQRVTIWDPQQHEIFLQDAQPLQELPPGSLKKTLSKWEMQVNWGHLSMKIPSQARGLVLASSLGIPPILVTESSSKEEYLSPRSRNWSQKPYRRMEVMEKKDKMLKSMKVEYTWEIVVVQEDIPVIDLNWNQAPKRRP